MKLCFNQGSCDHCPDHSMMADLEAAEKYGFDYIDLRFDVLDEYLKDHTAEELADWFKNHHLKPSSYSGLLFFNWKKTEEEKQKVFDEVKRLLPVFDTIDLRTIAVIPSFGIEEHASVKEIKDDAVYMLNQIADLCEPYGISLALEFIGSGNFTINRFDTAYDIVTTVNRDNVGIAIDLFHFHAMASDVNDVAKCDGKKIINLHLNDVEDLPIGAPYLDDSKRLWPGEGAVNKQGLADALKACGFDTEAIPAAIEVFRPEYYELSVDENVKTAYETTKAFVEKYLA
ncbi:MAG: sugar phosphate isomerase/epimerase family protein [Lachnospiraceae bacterium]|nr:sugar phosphate isomerase/epimerase family protein [Lachnospiraceae bacterium]